MNPADALPNDLAACQRLLLAAFKDATQLERQVAEAEQRLAAATQRATQSAQQLAELGRVLDETAASFEELRQEHAATLEELAWYKRWVHGRRRERIIESPGQEHLFELTPPHTTEEELPAESSEARQEIAAPMRRRRQQRELDLSRLPHQRHEHDLSPEEKVCGCCGRAKDRIGEDITKILEYVPSQLEVHEHVRPKYACRHCQDGVSSPPPPERPIARGIAGPGLLAHIVVSKFGDHLPLYRQEDIWVRHGLHLARSTLCDWVSAAAELFRPLYELQRQRTLQSAVLWTDDTPVTVLVGGEEGSRQGRFWTYVGDDQHPYAVYDFTLSRERDGPQRFLQSFRGFLQADAYAGYDAIFLGSGKEIVEVACWAHARRKFFDARKSCPREAHQVLEWIQQLYDVEDRARQLTAAARCALRGQDANPVLDRLEAYLAQLAWKALPKSALGKAVTYARNQWAALRCYTTDGRLTIDNNTAERTLRPQAIGRNYAEFRAMRSGGRIGWQLQALGTPATPHNLVTADRGSPAGGRPSCGAGSYRTAPGCAPAPDASSPGSPPHTDALFPKTRVPATRRSASRRHRLGADAWPWYAAGCAARHSCRATKGSVGWPEQPPAADGPPHRSETGARHDDWERAACHRGQEFPSATRSRLGP